jgi:hypothetical protein
VVGLAWFFLSGSTDTNASLAALGQAPSIAPPDYAYLDAAQVALYLGQLQGGIANSEQLSEQLTKSATAGGGLGGFSASAAVGSTSTAERVVTPTATARFYQLLDLLKNDGYLHTVNEAGTPAAIEHAFARIPEGSFVKLTNCTLRVPSFVRLEEISKASRGVDPESVVLTAEKATSHPINYGDSVTLKTGAVLVDPVAPVVEALRLAGRIKGAEFHSTGAASTVCYAQECAAEARAQRRLANQAHRALRRLGPAIQNLDKAAGPDPRVPLSTCDGRPAVRPRGVDLLLPIELANLSSEQSLLSGPVTLVGKLVRAVRNPGEIYVDDASLATFGGPLRAIDDLTRTLDAFALTQGPGIQLGIKQLDPELTADAVVLPPGAVILPIAIYK